MSSVNSSLAHVVPTDHAALLPVFPLHQRPVHQQPATVYLASLATGSRRTMQSALLALVQLLLPEQPVTEETLAAFPWEDLRFEHTAALRARLAEQYKYTTANKHLAALRGVLKAAWQLELMTAEEYHKAASVKSIRGTTLPAGRSLKEGELRALLLVCQADTTSKGCRDLALIALLFATGLRRQEAAQLDLADYDAENHALRVRGKGQKERLVYVEATGAYEALHTWMTVRGSEPGPLFVRIRRGGHLVRTGQVGEPEQHADGALSATEPPFIKDRQGNEPTTLVAPLQGMTEQAIYAIVLARAEQAETLHLSTHDFRRTFIGELLDQGVDLSTAQKLAGHASPMTTAHYDRRPEATKKRAASTLHVPAIQWHPSNRQKRTEKCNEL